MRRGFSLIEILVVIGIFAIIAAVVSRATTVSLVGSRKSDASGKVRENLSHAVSIIERQLRSARSITTTCDGSPNSSISYTDQYGNASTFSCNPNVNCSSTSNTYIASGSATARLTNSDTICITSCQFTCNPSTGNLPPSIEISVEGRSKETSGIEDASVRLETGVSLRAY